MIENWPLFSLFLVSLGGIGLALLWEVNSNELLSPDNSPTAEAERNSLRSCRKVKDNPSIRAILRNYRISAAMTPEMMISAPPHFIITDKFVHDMLEEKSYPLNYTRFQAKEMGIPYLSAKSPSMVGPALIGVTLGYGAGLTSALAKENEYKTEYTLDNHLAVVYDPSTTSTPLDFRENMYLLLADDLIPQLPNNYNYLEYFGLSLSPFSSDDGIAHSLARRLTEMLLQCKNGTIVEQSQKLHSHCKSLLIASSCLLCICFILMGIFR